MKKIVLILILLSCVFSLSAFSKIEFLIRKNKIDELEEYLSQNEIDLNAMDSDHSFPLLYAIKNSNLEAFNILLSYGADPNQSLWDGSMLMYAVAQGDMNIITAMVEAGADPQFWSFVDGGMITAALSSENLEVLEYMIELGAPLNVPTEWSTPLIDAIKKNSVEIIKALVDGGAKINQEHKLGPYNYNSPFIALIYRQDYELFEYFVELGIEAKPLSKSGWTAFMSSAQINDVRIAKRLLELGVDPYAETEEGKTAMSIAEEEGNIEFIDFLNSL